MRDVDGGRRIYEIDFFFCLFCFLFFRAIGGVWEFGILVREVSLGEVR